MATILMVEDHQKVAQLTARYLQNRGAVETVAIVQTGEAALTELARRNDARESLRLPDLLLIDVSLPGISGLELLEEVRSKYPDLLCLMLSGHKEGSYVRRSMNAGARGFILKGKPPALLEGVQQVLNGELYLSEELRDYLPRP